MNTRANKQTAPRLQNDSWEEKKVKDQRPWLTGEKPFGPQERVRDGTGARDKKVMLLLD